MPKPVPQFHKIGSDPEFLFVTRQEFRAQVVPAHTIISSNRTIALKSFIGTDNHQATAELRPRPAHNIGRHLYDIAYGLHETDKWLAGHKKFNDIKIVAQPVVNEEPLGGHIHCSFFIDEPLTKMLQSINRVFNGERIMVLDPEQPVPELTQIQVTQLNEYTQKLYQDSVFNKNDFARYLDYLIWPFECAIQPWWDRTRRNGRYGGLAGAGERVRQNISYPDGASKFNKFAYLHYEYRVPSTWLCHPWLAYAYLGLAKLAMLNVPLILEDTKTHYPRIAGNTPFNDEFKILFDERFRRLQTKGKWSRDLRALVEVIPQCFNARSSWFEVSGQPIDIDAWRKLT